MTDRTTPVADIDLDAAASRYDIPKGDVDAVLRRARRAAGRRRVASAIVAVAALVGGGVASQSLLTSPATTAIPVTTDGGAVRGDTGIVWRKAVPRAGLSGLGMTTDSTGAGPLYALSTAAGERFTEKTRRNSVLWTSDDGVDWTAVATVDGDLRLSSLVSTPGRLYAVGTAAPASSPRGAFEVVAGWSDDEGRSFSRATLPIDLLRHRKAASINVHGASIASGDKGTVIVVTVAASLDVAALVPEGAPRVRRWVATPSGVDILGDGGAGCSEGEEIERLDKVPEPVDLTGFRCGDRDGKASRRTPQEIFGVVASYTFDELGVDDELRRFVRRQPLVFHAAAGSTAFERVDVGETPPLFGPPLVEAHEDGFEIVSTAGEANDVPVVFALHSPDGQTFERSDGVPALSWISGIGRVRGVTTIVGGNEGGTSILRSRGDGTWSTTPLASVIDPDVLDGRTPQAFVAGIGDFGIVLSALLSDRDGDGGKLPESRLVMSRDGVHFEDVELKSLVGEEKIRGVHRILVTADRAVVTVATGEASPEGVPSQQVALIAVGS